MKWEIPPILIKSMMSSRSTRPIDPKDFKWIDSLLFCQELPEIYPLYQKRFQSFTKSIKFNKELRKFMMSLQKCQPNQNLWH